MNIAVIAGTSEARECIQALLPLGDVTAFTATEYGARLLENLNCSVRTGRLDAIGFANVLKSYDIVIDATHPFAVLATEQLKQACSQLKLPYIRLERKEEIYSYSRIISVSGKEQAAAVLNQIQGNILFTTGGNTVNYYAEHVQGFEHRAWIRVLDTPDAHRFPVRYPAHYIYGTPPFSQTDTEQLLNAYQIAVLVTKDSGARGGVLQKLEAARSRNIPVVLLRRPTVIGSVHTVSEVIQQVKESIVMK